MADLSLTYDDLRAEVGFYLGYGRASALWTAEAEEAVNSCVKSGLRAFYFPTLVGKQTAHDWSFLKPTAIMPIESGKVDYEMPADFGSIIGDFYHEESDQTYCPVHVRGEAMIRHKRAAWATSTGQPALAALRPKATLGVVGQRHELMIWPTPDGAYSLNYRYRVLPAALDDVRQHPYGGAAHAETILESCLAVAEQRVNDAAGVHSAAFMSRLAASMSTDAQSEPDNLGYNGDRSDGMRSWKMRHSETSTVTYDGFQ